MQRVFVDKNILMLRRPKPNRWFWFSEAERAALFLEKSSLLRGNDVGLWKFIRRVFSRLLRDDENFPRGSGKIDLEADNQAILQLNAVYRRFSGIVWETDYSVIFWGRAAFESCFELNISGVERHPLEYLDRGYFNRTSLRKSLDVIPRYSEFFQGCGGSLDSKKTGHHLWDAFYLYLCELNGCDFFLTKDYRLIHKMKDVDKSFDVLSPTMLRRKLIINGTEDKAREELGLSFFSFHRMIQKDLKEQGKRNYGDFSSRS